MVWLEPFFYFSVALLPMSASAEPLVQKVEEHNNEVGAIEKRASDFVHRGSQFIYPNILGEMPARKTVTYGEGDAAVNYTLLGGGNGDSWIDLFVYPARRTLPDESRDVQKSMEENAQCKRVSAPPGFPSAPPGAMDGWCQGSYRGTAILTGYRLVRSGDWYIKARITIPVRGGQAAVDRAMRGIGAIPWSGQKLLPAHLGAQPLTANG